MVFDVMLHFGTLVAIFVAFWADIKRLVVEGVCIVRDAVINVIIFFKNFNKPVREKTCLLYTSCGFLKYYFLQTYNKS